MIVIQFTLNQDHILGAYKQWRTQKISEGRAKA